MSDAKMFDTVLIANRGEIACRIIRTARAMGLGTVAIHSEIDRDAAHVEAADRAVAIGGAAPAESYLRGDRVIAAALEAGAGAIHPGYGFLSENPDFAADVTRAGLVFVGPSEAAIRAMGLKDAAKRVMAEAGVPVVPGYHGADQDPDRLAAEAAKVGYPVLIKAVAGGGGKGMRRVDGPGAFAEALDRAKAEARSAFGNDMVLIEAFVAKPRHIEVQVFGDGTRAVHLFERDCSLQRRHQKVIEEAPAPAMSAEMRAAMGCAAVRAAEAIGYSGAGTVEFIADASAGLRADRFFFMEMNTRLQVEHPVTEAVTGIDLVEWQLRVAAGEPLPAAQEALSITGHAIEARLYAENVPAGFLPAVGTLSHLRFPEDLRVDSGVRDGDTISPYYDPMIAKLIAHGPTREIALARLRRGLARTEVAGVITNLGFLAALTDDAGFASGDVHTGLIEEGAQNLTQAHPVTPAVRAEAALIAAGLDGPPGLHQGFTLWTPLRPRVRLRQAGEDLDAILVVQDADRVEIVIAGDTVVAERRGADWQFDGVPGFGGRKADAQVTVFAGGGVAFDCVDPLDRTVADFAGDGVTLAPMPGRVVSVHVVAGAQVAEGDRLVVLEAMKMEHTLRAGAAGRVEDLFVAEGAQVTAGEPLVRVAAASGTAPSGSGL